MSPEKRRQVVRELRRHGVTLQRTLDLLRMARATFYRESRSCPEEERLEAETGELALHTWPGKWASVGAKGTGRFSPRRPFLVIGRCKSICRYKRYTRLGLTRQP